MKKSYTRLCVTFLGVLALSLPVKADFQEGYVVTTGGDTLRGNIDMGSSRAMAHNCRFRSTETGKVTRYSPKELTSFSFTDLDRTFVSDTVPYFFKDRLLFLEVLQKGRINLYYTYDLVLNDLLYISKRDGDLFDLLFDWDKNKLIPLKSDYIDFLKKAMVDAPELLSEVERLDNPTASNLSVLIGKYNRRFDKSAKVATIPSTGPAVKEKKQLGISISPGIIIPDILYIDNMFIDGYYGLSVTKNLQKNVNRGLFCSVGAYFPRFITSTEHGRLETLSADPSYFETKFMVPASLTYRFSNNQLKPMIGLNLQLFYNEDESRFNAGPQFGLHYSPIKWLSLSCSVVYVFSEFYTKSIRYQTSSNLNLITELSINL